MILELYPKIKKREIKKKKERERERELKYFFVINSIILVLFLKGFL
jgi:hypothetical protein